MLSIGTLRLRPSRLLPRADPRLSGARCRRELGRRGYYLNGTEDAGEWPGACAALGRGSEANRLFAVPVVRDDRAEHGPGPGRPYDRLHAHVAALGYSTAQMLASEGAQRWTSDY
jgi:hypothetical protein